MNKIVSLFNPFSNRYHAQRDFKSINATQKFFTIVLTVFATIATLPILGLGGVATFRLLTKKFTLIEVAQEPVKIMAQKTERAVHSVDVHQGKQENKKTTDSSAPKKRKRAQQPAPIAEKKEVFFKVRKQLKELAKKNEINVHEVKNVLEAHEESKDFQKFIKSCVDDPALTPALRLVIADLRCSDAILEGLHARGNLASHHYEMIASFPPKKNTAFFEKLQKSLEEAFAKTIFSIDQAPPAVGIFRNPKYLEEHIQIFENAIGSHIRSQREIPEGVMVTIGDVFKACQTTSCLRELFESSLHFIGSFEKAEKCGHFAQPFLDALNEAKEDDWKRLFVFKSIRTVDLIANRPIAKKSLQLLETRYKLNPSEALKKSWNRFSELADWRKGLQGTNFELKEDLMEEDVPKIFPLMGCTDKAYVKSAYGEMAFLPEYDKRLFKSDRALASKLNEKFPGSISDEFMALLNFIPNREEMKKCLDGLKEPNVSREAEVVMKILEGDVRKIEGIAPIKRVKAVVKLLLTKEYDVWKDIVVVADQIPRLGEFLKKEKDFIKCYQGEDGYRKLLKKCESEKL